MINIYFFIYYKKNPRIIKSFSLSLSLFLSFSSFLWKDNDAVCGSSSSSSSIKKCVNDGTVSVAAADDDDDDYDDDIADVFNLSLCCHNLLDSILRYDTIK